MFKVVINNDEVEYPDDDIFYIVAKNGQFIRKNMGLIDSLVPVKSISILNDIKPYVTMNIPKIPSKVFTKVVSFFKNVYRIHKSEAVVMLYLENDAKKYYIHVPEQEVSGASVEYKRDVSFPGKTLVGTIHSHSNFGAFHSGTDKDDEKSFDGVHITVGNLGEEFYHSVVCSLVSNGFRVKVEPEEYMNIVKNSTKDYIVLESYFPLEWLSQVRKIQISYKWRSQRGNKRQFNRFREGYGYFDYNDYLDEQVRIINHGVHSSYAKREDLMAPAARFKEKDPGFLIIGATEGVDYPGENEPDQDILELCDPASYRNTLFNEIDETITKFQREKICNACHLIKECCATCLYNEEYREKIKADKQRLLVGII